MYLNLSVFKQMFHCQAASLEFLERKEKLQWENLDQIVILTLVSKFSDLTKEQLKKRKFQLLPFGEEKGVYQTTSLVDHYVFVIDELPFDSAILELFKYTKDKTRIRNLVTWLQEHEEESRQKEILLELIELYPQFKKEVLKMIPISSDPKVNQEYIGNVYEGFGVDDILNYAKKNYKEEIARNFIKENDVPGLFDQLNQAGLSLEEMRNYLDNLEKKTNK